MEFESCAQAPSGWARVTIASVCDRFTSGGTPSRRRPEFFENGVIPWVKTKELLDGVLDDAEEWITEDAILASSAKRLPANTILMAMYGATVGQLGVLGREMACNQACAAMIVDDAVCDYRFLYYQLLANRRQIVSMATGAAQQNLSGAQIKSWVLPLPDRGEQASIAHVLWTLDERIASLRHTNATLEAIAQALFKSWFVDFDPVRAKAEGREPEEMDAATAALFPADFEGSELGDIPKGWRVASLQEHITAERGLSYKGTGLAEDGVPMHNLNSVLEGGGYKYSGIKYYRGDYKDRHIAQPGDIIVANTEQGHHHRLIGFPAVVPRSFETGIYSHHLYRVRIQEHSGLTPEWLYQCLMGSAVRDQIIGCANGSTVNMLKPAGLQMPRFAVPSGELCAAFDAIANPIREIAEANVARIGNLSALRDTLLPRLISGKLRLPDAEVEIEAAFT